MACGNSPHVCSGSRRSLCPWAVGPRPFTWVLALESQGSKELWWRRVVILGHRPSRVAVGWCRGFRDQKPEPSQEAGLEASWNLSRKGPAWRFPRSWAEAHGAESGALETEAPCVPQVFLWEQQRLAGRLPRGGTGDSVLLPLAQGSHRPLSRAQSSPAAPASLPTPEPASQARVLPSSETPARTLPFTTGRA